MCVEAAESAISVVDDFGPFVSLVMRLLGSEFWRLVGREARLTVTQESSAPNSSGAKATESEGASEAQQRFVPAHLRALGIARFGC